MGLIGLKRRASTADFPRTSVEKKRSRIFRRTSTNVPTSALPSPPAHGPDHSPFTRLRRRGSHILIKLHMRKLKKMVLILLAPLPAPMDGNSSPHHRILTPPAPVLLAPTKPGKFRKLFSPSSSQEIIQTPQRKRSVRFEGVPNNSQLDGQPGPDSETTPIQQTRESHRSSLSQRLSDQMESLSAKLNGTAGTETIVHRTSRKQTPTVPFIDTQVSNGEDVNASPSATSPFSPSSHNTTWSPVGTASTAATSWTSPRSSGPKSRNQHTPEDCQHVSKSVSGGAEESPLPPIEEDSGRFLMIPVQEAPVEAHPSIATVENVAAAKVYFETLFQKLLLEPSSPRSIRRKRFEHKMADLGLSHDERVQARQQWIRTESDHLRQMRVLNSSSIARHRVKGVSIAGFDVIRILGKGSFGVVRLVTERAAHSTPNTNGSEPRHTSGGLAFSNVDDTAKHNLPTGKPLSDVFAMKVIRKSDMLRACQEGHLRAERDFLVGAEGSRWVVPLIASFQDNTNLYLVMEYMIGGDFLGLLLREDVLDEDVAK
ncbi:hypothetical protein LTR37_001120 [Vermiconidia calcicola]|uniref:Uncharacterized protein n=1 Tax=Vermiconidia calcicola TaxID=1690605 RepID=A0ACC3NX90_9PEZI|nr:hypothetical protein LTR37_001120 [Vermiconidia calcicola]